MLNIINFPYIRFYMSFYRDHLQDPYITYIRLFTSCVWWNNLQTTYHKDENKKWNLKKHLMMIVSLILITLFFTLIVYRELW